MGHTPHLYIVGEAGQNPQFEQLGTDDPQRFQTFIDYCHRGFLRIIGGEKFRAAPFHFPARCSEIFGSDNMTYSLK